ncbi:hypothetical protein SK355_04190 [Candidatus Fukatsuia symbiotica]|uniref:Uncharacterized protein n=1 Tax=Candidatus Fukatsuia symbiotica TaxID=1878942 RepID=A0A2U8I516_9GAMM|nr:hypothetical protein [Candidatus Fukatsuia symbiotica]AWK14256.1 hypothetical protein CCS41_06865 [Candidatus Fukatsuia symbiotica]MEA9444503.1 hypothetical protein [Candidatus Fukatsuia symbiotica]
MADIGIPRFNAATRAHSTTYAESLSAYRALGFTLSPTPQHEKLKSTQYLLLPAALKGHYTFMHDTGADGRLAGKAIFNRFGAYYHASDNGVFEISGDHAPNHVVFHPLATEYVIELDQGERIFAFQSPQEFTHIEGDDHEGLHSGRLPTPMIDAQHAHLLTYRFKGAGGTTRIDVFDDQRQIIIEPHKDPVQRKKEHWIVDITPDALDARVNREKAWLALRERTAIAYGDALLVLLNMGIDQAEVKKIHDQLVDRIRSKAQMSAEEMALLALLPLGFGVYTLIQSQADLLSDAKTPVNLSDLLAVAAPFIQKLNDRDQTTGTTLQQRHIAQLRLEQRDGGWDLQLTNNKKVRIDGDLPGDMGLRMRLAALPGVTVTFTLQKQGEETPKFSIGLEAENKDALLGDNLTTAVTFIREKFSDRTRFVVDDTVSVTLPLTPDQLPAKGWLNLTTVRWQVIQVEQPYLYCSNGTAVDTIELLGISCIARIKYDQDLKQPYVAAIVHPRDNLKTSVSYRYYPHLPAGQRYQQIEVIAFNESADQETQPLTQLIGAIYPHTSQAIIRVNSHTAALGAEYAWDGRQPFFKKIAWEQDNYHFIAERHDSVSPSTLMVIANPSVSPTEWAIHRLGADFAVKYRNALSSITLLLQDNTTRINLWGFPAIPINVFANVEAKIINPLPGSTFFLHSTELPGVTFKLSSLPPSNEQCLRWGLSLYAKDNAAVEGENRAEILRILRHHANNAVFPWVVDPAVPLSIGNHPDGEAEGVFELPPRLVSSETPAAAIGEIPDDSAGMREAMSTFEGGEREESPGARNEAHLPAPRILSGPGRSVALANF